MKHVDVPTSIGRANDMSHVPNGEQDGRIRWGRNADVPAIARLMRRVQRYDNIPRASEVDIVELMRRGEIIVLGLTPGELVAAACVTTSNGHGHLAFLVVDPEIDGLEARIRGVAAAVSESERCAPTFASRLPDAA